MKEKWLLSIFDGGAEGEASVRTLAKPDIYFKLALDQQYIQSKLSHKAHPRAAFYLNLGSLLYLILFAHGIMSDLQLLKNQTIFFLKRHLELHWIDG